MNTASDAVVVGCGPVGAFAAWNLSKLGIDVTVFEEHAKVGVPSHCAGHLSIRGLKSLGLDKLPSGIVENTYSGANFYSAKGTKFSVRLRKPVTCSVNRILFDRFLMQKATEAGATVLLNSRAKSLVVRNGRVFGVNVDQLRLGERQSEARVVVDCEGISSRLVRQAELAVPTRKEIVYGVEAEVENVEDVVSDEVEVYLGSDYAPGFYAWLMPRRDGTAKVGLAATRGSPKELFQKVLSRHPAASKQLSKAKVRQTTFHSISLGGPILRTYANGFLVVGDAASQVKPTTGGGVVFGLTCAKIAAEVVAEAIRKNNTSSNFLKQYQDLCDRKLGFDFRTMLIARKFIYSLSDRKIDDALRFSHKFKLSEALRDVDEIDLQGQTLLRTIGKPALFVGLAYLLLLYLTANP
ncbi:TPA: NAD(P)/FAD-dependent oxidoreductase [Candidatus Bathyarchaeota archaeon]|nr:NAD(P)/FAD-dependent oxidoreductase [Candidatus Bathyarchaeota archaeon]HIJ08817.1 NAD(P)/FAD-dependent oxidoreductase [Candidatus Bathyarchaeota archaeon]